MATLRRNTQLLDLEINRGGTFVLEIAMFESDEETPLDLASYTTLMHIRKTIDAPDAELELDDANGITLGGAEGTIAVTITADQTDLLEPGRHVYDLLLVKDESVDRILEGKITVFQGVTR
jgi:hypothetical protein